MRPARVGAIVAVLLGLGFGGWYLYEGALWADLREGEKAVAAGRPDLAEAAFRRALSRDPENERAMYGIGWAWHMAGEQDSAREAFTLLKEVHPESPLGYKGLGSVWMAEGNVPEARKAFEAAKERAGDGPEALKIEDELALLELGAGNGAAALAAFDQLVALDPDSAEFHWGRAESLLLVGRGEDALKAAGEAVDLAPEGGRVRGMALITRARTLLEVSGGRVDPARCAETAPPVYAWLDAADRDLDAAEAMGMDLPSVRGVRRTVLSRRGKVDDACPGLRVIGKGSSP